MNVEEALFILDTVLQQKFLNNVQELVFRQAWAGKTYPEMAESSGYNAQYIKDVGYKLWKLLSSALEEKVTKSNFQSVLRRQYFAFQHAWRASYPEEIASPKDIASAQGIGETQQTPVVNTVQAAPLKVDAKETIANPKKGQKDNWEGHGELGSWGASAHSPHPSSTRSDWAEEVDVSAAYECTEELKTLKQWIVDALYRLVALLGMGAGQTHLNWLTPTFGSEGWQNGSPINKFRGLE